ncbi:hypothetical protein GEMRC1_012018 [Eukaryota sp. GEM-RC1]
MILLNPDAFVSNKTVITESNAALYIPHFNQLSNDLSSNSLNTLHHFYLDSFTFTEFFGDNSAQSESDGFTCSNPGFFASYLKNTAFDPLSHHYFIFYGFLSTSAFARLSSCLSSNFYLMPGTASRIFLPSSSYFLLNVPDHLTLPVPLESCSLIPLPKSSCESLLSEVFKNNPRCSTILNFFNSVVAFASDCNNSALKSAASNFGTLFNFSSTLADLKEVDVVLWCLIALIAPFSTLERANILIFFETTPFFNESVADEFSKIVDFDDFLIEKCITSRLPLCIIGSSFFKISKISKSFPNYSILTCDCKNFSDLKSLRDHVSRILNTISLSDNSKNPVVLVFQNTPPNYVNFIHYLSKFQLLYDPLSSTMKTLPKSLISVVVFMTDAICSVNSSDVTSTVQQSFMIVVDEVQIDADQFPRSLSNQLNQLLDQSSFTDSFDSDIFNLCKMFVSIYQDVFSQIPTHLQNHWNILKSFEMFATMFVKAISRFIDPSTSSILTLFNQIMQVNFSSTVTPEIYTQIIKTLSTLSNDDSDTVIALDSSSLITLDVTSFSSQWSRHLPESFKNVLKISSLTKCISKSVSDLQLIRATCDCKLVVCENVDLSYSDLIFEFSAAISPVDILEYASTSNLIETFKKCVISSVLDNQSFLIVAEDVFDESRFSKFSNFLHAVSVSDFSSLFSVKDLSFLLSSSFSAMASEYVLLNTLEKANVFVVVRSNCSDLNDLPQFKFSSYLKSFKFSEWNLVENVDDVIDSIFESSPDNRQSIKDFTHPLATLFQNYSSQFMALSDLFKIFEYFQDLLRIRSDKLTLTTKSLEAAIDSYTAAKESVQVIVTRLTTCQSDLQSKIQSKESLEETISDIVSNVNDKKSKVNDVQEKTEEKTQRAQTLHLQIESALSTVTSQLTSSMSQVQSLSIDDLMELQAIQKPSLLIEYTAEALCMLLGVDVSWNYFKKMIGKENFKNLISTYNKNTLTSSTRKSLHKYLTRPDFKSDVIQRQSLAAGAIASFVCSVTLFFDTKNRINLFKKSLMTLLES